MCRTRWWHRLRGQRPPRMGSSCRGGSPWATGAALPRARSRRLLRPLPAGPSRAAERPPCSTPSATALSHEPSTTTIATGLCSAAARSVDRSQASLAHCHVPIVSIDWLVKAWAAQRCMPLMATCCFAGGQAPAMRMIPPSAVPCPPACWTTSSLSPAPPPCLPSSEVSPRGSLRSARGECRAVQSYLPG